MRKLFTDNYLTLREQLTDYVAMSRYLGRMALMSRSHKLGLVVVAMNVVGDAIQILIGWRDDAAVTNGYGCFTSGVTDVPTRFILGLVYFRGWLACLLDPPSRIIGIPVFGFIGFAVVGLVVVVEIVSMISWKIDSS